MEENRELRNESSDIYTIIFYQDAKSIPWGECFSVDCVGKIPPINTEMVSTYMNKGAPGYQQNANQKRN